METKNCHISVHAKCILTGEHAVLRGYPAIVFPIKTKHLELDYSETEQAITVNYNCPYGETFLLFFNATLQEACKYLNYDRYKLTGNFFLTNNIPMGAGMGFSAALCALITQWLIWKGFIKHENLISFARSLEDSHHGKSSGVDVAGAITESAIMYWANRNSKPLKLTWKPKLYLSYCEKSNPTADCVNDVNELYRQNPQLAKLIDQEMAHSTLLSKQALIHDADRGFNELVIAIEKAKHCFEKWGLITEPLKAHIEALHALGAAATKPTGSGKGGYVLSLWQEPPPKNIPFKLISVF